ncbi:Uncharacterized protein HZ326_14932 [Fusarium oxysporum f. sp. albedinis]|nr:Uncharacterized protein HZ326_14932 [Fusarium oxysporum f. sp. albedinis]
MPDQFFQKDAWNLGGSGNKQCCLYGNLCLATETSLRSSVTSRKPYRAVEQPPSAPQYHHTQYTRTTKSEIGKCLETCLQVLEWPSDGRAGTGVHDGAWGLVNAPRQQSPH